MEKGAGAKTSKSRWQRLLGAFRRNRSAEDAHCLKHSHNCSNATLRAGISNMKGYKKVNQDRCTAFSYLEKDPELSFFGVYDGHGGTGVANYLKDHLHEFILEQPEYREGNMEEAILKGFLQADQELRSYGPATELTGSTATVAMVRQGELVCANLGDSRAIASVRGVLKAITSDHNTSNAKERERVIAMGGSIKDNRVGGVLIPTRSFGDFLLKSEMDKPAWKQVISVVPQIVSHRLNSSWDFVVVASDGVWDAVTNRELVALVRDRLSGDDDDDGKKKKKTVLSELCEEILDMCCTRTVEKFGRNACDNMTIIIIVFDIPSSSSHSSSMTSSSAAGISAIATATAAPRSETGSSSVVTTSSVASR